MSDNDQQRSSIEVKDGDDYVFVKQNSNAESDASEIKVGFDGQDRGVITIDDLEIDESAREMIVSSSSSSSPDDLMGQQGGSTAQYNPSTLKDDKPVMINMKLSKELMKISVRKLRLQKPMTAALFLRLMIGHQSFDTSTIQVVAGSSGSVAFGGSNNQKQSISSQQHGQIQRLDQELEWNESFTFHVPYHSLLFNTLCIDLYQSRFMLNPLLLGRAELKLSLLKDVPTQFQSWFELITPSHYQQVRQRSRLRKFSQASQNQQHQDQDQFNIGAVQVVVDHQFDQLSAFKENQLDLINNASASSDEEDSHHLRRSIITQDVQMNKSYTELMDESSGGGKTIFQQIGSVILSEETFKAIQGIQNMFQALNQGSSISNADFIKGYLLLEKYFYYKDQLQSIRSDISESKGLYGGEIVKDLDKIQTGRQFYRFALATYGWKGLNFFGKGQGIVRDSARKDADRKTVMEYLNLTEDVMLDFSLNYVGLYRPSYFVVKDSFTNSIAMCIRGTMSTIDALTDLACDYTPWKDGFVHGGIMLAAQRFMDNVIPRVIELADQHNIQNINVIGHSLGGATAAMLTMMMQDRLSELNRLSNQQRPLKVHCYSYAPPPVVSVSISKRYLDVIDTFILEDDAVCRMSYGHIMDFKIMLTEVLEIDKYIRGLSKKNNWLTSIIPFVGNNNSNDIESNQNSSNKKTSSNSTQLWSDKEKLKLMFAELDHVRDSILHPRDPKMENIKLALAGTIYHMYYDERERRPYQSMMPKYPDVDQLLDDMIEVNEESVSSTRSAMFINAMYKDQTWKNSRQLEKSKSLPLNRHNTLGSTSSSSSTSLKSNMKLPSINLFTPEMKKKAKTYKGVVVEKSTAENFKEFLVRRTALLEHVPNTYDKAFDRAFESLMMELAFKREQSFRFD
ncbi:hypothetical protein MP228_011130 [Amoeboaphelidium protococcarum]|nr:hypothetical protein MP228_011130 [Amoeboaphelidium protococcarum]